MKCYHVLYYENKTPEDTIGLICQAYRANIKFSDIESLVKALGGVVREGDGSRVVLELSGTREYAHRPHPGKEAKKYMWLRLSSAGLVNMI